MKKSKYPPVVYEALKGAGHSNVEIGKMLGVSEAAVRRGLNNAESAPGRRPDGLDPWPDKRPSSIVFIDAPEGSFAVDAYHGNRLLRVPRGMAADAELGRAVRKIRRLL